MKAKDITGQVFGKLTALEPTDKRRGNSVVWRCSCACGNIKEFTSKRLLAGKTTSCGCKTSAVDITGQVFGKLTALEPTDKRSGSHVIWRCSCACGNITEVSLNNLRAGKTQSCGCMTNAIDITGQVFGRLTALEPTDKRIGTSIAWRCQCVCGNIIEVSASSLRGGIKKSCGCKTNAVDITGQVFGRLTALEPTDKRRGNSVVWRCLCACSNIAEVSAYALRAGTKSCGCLRIDHKESSLCLDTRVTQLKVPEEKLRSNNTSGATGVSWRSYSQRWIARIGFMHRTYTANCRSFEEAVALRQKMRQARDEFVEWWDSLSEEDQSKIAKDIDVKRAQQQLFEARIKRIL